MRRNLIPVMALGLLCVLAASAEAVEISGSIGLGADVLPAFNLDADFEVTVSDDAWSISSGTNVDLLPAFGVTEQISLTYSLDPVRLAASLSMAFAPFDATGDISAAMDLFTLTLREEDPAIAVSSELTLGVSIDAALDPYAQFYTLISLGNHWLSNTTTVTFIPFGATSSVLAYLSLGEFSIADGDVIVTPYGYVALDVVPFGFNYVQANADVAVDGISIRNSVTYWGDTTFDVSSTLTIDLDPVTLTLWASFAPGGTDLFAVGASAGFSWGPL